MASLRAVSWSSDSTRTKEAWSQSPDFSLPRSYSLDVLGRFGLYIIPGGDLLPPLGWGGPSGSLG